MDQEKSAVFEETYEKYMKQIREISSAKFPRMGAVLGVEIRDNAFEIPFFQNLYFLSHAGIVDQEGNSVPFVIRVALLKYVLMCPDEEPSPDSSWVTYKDFKDAAPLINHFNSTVNHAIIKTFSGKVDLLERAVTSMGGRPSPMFKESYDLSMMLHTLPRIPIIINFNDQDDEFPAICSVLYQKNTEHYLDMESLSITGTYCAAKLVAFAER